LTRTCFVGSNFNIDTGVTLFNVISFNEIPARKKDVDVYSNIKITACYFIRVHENLLNIF